MVIGIDAGALCSVQNTGMSRFSSGIINALLKTGRNHFFKLFVFGKVNKKLLASTEKNYQIVFVKPESLWSTFSLSGGLIFNKVDAFLGLNQSLPLLSIRNSYSVFHDIGFLKDKNYNFMWKLRMRYLTINALKKSRKIFAVSGKTADDLISEFNIDKNRIIVQYSGIGELFRKKNLHDINSVKKKYGIKIGYFIYVGSMNKNKNIHGLTKGFANFNKKFGYKYSLLLCGQKTDSISQEYLNNNKIKHLGYVEDNFLPALYSGAKGYINASFYEGFNFPLLEAMNCGCHAIVSKNSAMNEIGGEYGSYFDPYDNRSLENCLTEFIKEENHKPDNTEKLNNYLKKFSWIQAGKNYLNIIEKDMNRS